MPRISAGPGVTVSNAPTVGTPTAPTDTPAVGISISTPRTRVEISEVFYYEHIQTVPAAEWTIQHNLGKKPNVSVYDQNGDEILIDYTHLDNNTIYIHWPSPTTGTAICS